MGINALGFYSIARHCSTDLENHLEKSIIPLGGNIEVVSERSTGELVFVGDSIPVCMLMKE